MAQGPDSATVLQQQGSQSHGQNAVLAFRKDIVWSDRCCASGSLVKLRQEHCLAASRDANCDQSPINVRQSPEA